jgi:hypothetical protein
MPPAALPWIADACAIAALSFFVYAGEILFWFHGQYSGKDIVPFSAALLLTAAALFTGAKLRGHRHPGLDRAMPAAIALAAAIGLRLNVISYPINHGQGSPFYPWFRGTEFLAVLAAVIGGLLALAKPPGKAAERFLIGALILTFAALVFIPRISPAPFIDVFVNNTAATDYVLQGKNPYPQAYAELYNGGFGYKPGFLYFPGTFLGLVMGRALFGDIRAGMLIALAIGSLALGWTTLREKLDARWRYGLPTLALAFAVMPFVVEQSWIDPLLVAPTILGALLVSERRWIGAGVAFGILIATKQYGFVMAGLLGLWALRLDANRALTRAAPAALCTALVFLAPFTLANPSVFYASTIASQMKPPMRIDAFNLAVHFARNNMALPVPVALALSASGGIFSAAWLAFRKRPELADAAAALFASFATAFLFGKWAFCNYWYLVCAFIPLWLAGFFSRSDQGARLWPTRPNQ